MDKLEQYYNIEKSKYEGMRAFSELSDQEKEAFKKSLGFAVWRLGEAVSEFNESVKRLTIGDTKRAKKITFTLNVSKMTPSQMFQNYGSGEKTSFQKGDKVNTPNGIADFISQFTRGLKWWCETTQGTFTAETINELNPKNKAPTCGTCGSADTYTTTAYHCRRCATTTEM